MDIIEGQEYEVVIPPLRMVGAGRQCGYDALVDNEGDYWSTARLLDTLNATVTEVDGTAMEVERLLAAHEAEVRAKVAAEIAAAANFEPSCNEDIAHYDALMFAARIANPTTTEADA